MARGSPDGAGDPLEQIVLLEVEGPDVDASPSATSSRRVATGRRRPSLRYLVALVAVLLVGAAVARAGIGGHDDRDGGGAPGEDASGAASGTDSTDPTVAYATATRALGHARTLTYDGTVRAAAPSVLRPGSWIADEVTVHGAVNLPLSITTEVAVGPDGTAAETVTSGSAVWTREAPDEAALASASWTAVDDVVTSSAGLRPADPPPSHLGMALVVDAVRAAGDRRSASADDEGRRVIRATVSDQWQGSGVAAEEVAAVVGGADIAVTLDRPGIVRIEMSTAPGAPAVRVDVSITRRGGSDLVAARDVAGPIAATLPAGVLEDVGLASIEVSGLPTTWALIQARVDPGDDLLGSPPCAGPLLSLGYADLASHGEVVPGGWLGLSVSNDACRPRDEGARFGPAPRDGVDVTAGRFSGWALSARGGGTRGSLTDGTTSVWFSTDLPLEDAAAAIASLPAS